MNCNGGTIKDIGHTPKIAWWAAVRAHLCGEASAGVHDERPELMAAGHGGDVQAVVVALLHVLVHARVGDVVVVALLHGAVRIVDGDPLRRRQPQPDLLLGRLQERQTGSALGKVKNILDIQQKTAL